MNAIQAIAGASLAVTAATWMLLLGLAGSAIVAALADNATKRRRRRRGREPS
jgi:hypothetical protein